VTQDFKRAAGLAMAWVVMAVASVSLLAGVLIPGVMTASDDDRRTRASADLEVIARAFSAFRADTKAFPSAASPVPAEKVMTADHDLTAYRCFYASPASVVGWKGPYLQHGAIEGGVMQVALPATSSRAGAGLLDPWGQPYRVFAFAVSEGRPASVAIVSRGPDGIVNSSSTDVLSGQPAGDDLIKHVP
jgi:type II secretory pathway pseudopilin PulG